MCNPTGCSMIKIKRLGGYLKNLLRFILQLKYQEGCKNITVWTDTDIAGCQDKKINIRRGSAVGRAHHQNMEHASVSDSIVFRGSRIIWDGQRSISWVGS